MKLTFLALICFVSTAAAWPFGARLTPIPAATPIISARQYIERARDLSVKQRERLGAVQFRLTTALRSIDQGQLKITALESEVKTVAGERDNWKLYGDSQHDKFMNAEKRVAEGKAAIYKRDMIIGILMLLIAAYAVAKFYFRVPFI